MIRRINIYFLVCFVLLAATSCKVSKPKTAAEYVAKFGGRLEVYKGILSMTDCKKLQEQFDLASNNNNRASPGTSQFRMAMGYMQAADGRMRSIGCY